MNVAALVQLQRPVFPSSFPFLRSFEENHVCSLASGGKEILQLCPGVASKKGTREASLEVQKLQLFPLNLDIMMVHLNHQVPATIHCVFQSLFNRVTISEKQCLYVIKDSKVDLSFYNSSLYNVSCRTRWNCSLMKKKKIGDCWGWVLPGQTNSFWFMWCVLQNAVRAASVVLSGHLEPDQQPVSTSPKVTYHTQQITLTHWQWLVEAGGTGEWRSDGVQSDS